jgi:hypothetical protein
MLPLNKPPLNQTFFFAVSRTCCRTFLPSTINFFPNYFDKLFIVARNPDDVFGRKKKSFSDCLFLKIFQIHHLLLLFSNKICRHRRFSSLCHDKSYDFFDFWRLHHRQQLNQVNFFFFLLLTAEA